MVQVGLMVEGQEGLDWRRWLRLGALAEELGLDSLHRSDHLTGIEGDSGRRVLSLWPSLAVLAASTGRIRLGPLVSPVTWHHPELFAMQALDVDELSGGRLDVGMGAGWFEAEHTRFGLPYPRYAERLALLDTAATVVRSRWRGTGPHLLMGGKGPRTLRVVARHAQEWNCSYVGAEELAAKSAALDEACRAEGRAPAEVARSVMVPAVVGRDDAQVQERIDAQRRTFASLPRDLAGWRAAGFVGGRPEQVVDQLRAFVAAGATRFMLQHNDLDDTDSVRLLAAEVLPALRADVPVGGAWAGPPRRRLGAT